MKMVVLGAADWMGHYCYCLTEEYRNLRTDQEYLNIRDTTLCLRLGARV